MTKTAKVYTEQLLNEVNDERAKLGKKAVKTEDDDENDPPAVTASVERTCSERARMERRMKDAGK